jgi:hypothetical protein
MMLDVSFTMSARLEIVTTGGIICLSTERTWKCTLGREENRALSKQRLGQRQNHVNVASELIPTEHEVVGIGSLFLRRAQLFDWSCGLPCARIHIHLNMLFGIPPVHHKKASRVLFALVRARTGPAQGRWRGFQRGCIRTRRSLSLKELPPLFTQRWFHALIPAPLAAPVQGLQKKKKMSMYMYAMLQVIWGVFWNHVAKDETETAIHAMGGLRAIYSFVQISGCSCYASSRRQGGKPLGTAVLRCVCSTVGVSIAAMVVFENLDFRPFTPCCGGAW